MPRSRTASVILSTLAITVALFAVPAAATAADGPPAYYPSGPQQNVDPSALTDWTLCFTDTFADSAPLYGAGGILSELCTGDYLMLAGGAADSTELLLLAVAPRADVIFETGNDLTTSHAANGSEWYFNSSQSWGFALGGDAVNKDSCDYNAQDPAAPETNSELRLCYHAGNDSITSGYRIGNLDLNDDDSYVRYIYQSNGSAAVVPAPAAAPTLPDTGADASAPLLLAGGLLVGGLALAAGGVLRRRRIA